MYRTDPSPPLPPTSYSSLTLGPMGVVNLLIDLLFLMDFVKNHFTGYIDKNVNVVVDPWMIKLNYWKSW